MRSWSQTQDMKSYDSKIADTRLDLSTGFTLIRSPLTALNSVIVCGARISDFVGRENIVVSRPSGRYTRLLRRIDNAISMMEICSQLTRGRPMLSVHITGALPCFACTLVNANSGLVVLISTSRVTQLMEVNIHGHSSHAPCLGDSDHDGLCRVFPLPSLKR